MPVTERLRLPTANLVLPATFAALKHRNFRLWFFGQMISQMGTWMKQVAQGWLVYEITGSMLALGTISFLGSMPTLFLMIPAGAIGDRLPKRYVLMATQTTMMICAFTLAWLSGTHRVQVWHVGMVAFVVGIANSFDAPTRHSMVVELVEDRRDVMNAVALNSTLFNLARIVGPAIAGFLLAYVGAAPCFLINGFTFLAVLLALWFIRPPENVQAVAREPLLTQVRTGLHYVRHNQAIRVLLLLSSISGLFGFMYPTLMPALAADVLHVGEEGLGTLNAAVGVGALSASLIMASLGGFRRKGLLVTVGSLLFPCTLILFSASRSYPLSAALLAVVGFALVTQNATINTLMQSLAPDDLRTRVMALFALSFFGTHPFSALLSGALAEAFGPATAVGIGAAIALVFAVGLLLRAPSLRNLEA